jgi:DNA-directed RNA polymerase specialized sigma24 family protein
MNWLHRIAHRLFAARFRKEPTPGTVARMRLAELRREHRRAWEIRPPSSESELPGTELGGFPDKTASRVTEQPANTIRISVNRVR